MTRSQRVTEEQIAAAQLRVLLDEKQGRTTPDVVRKIAKSLPGDEVSGVGKASSSQTDAETALGKPVLWPVEYAPNLIAGEFAISDKGTFYAATPMDLPIDVVIGRHNLTRQVLWLPHDVHEVEPNAGVSLEAKELLRHIAETTRSSEEAQDKLGRQS
ncbi:hypothetical protein [Amycolatopsis sp. TNS106]|uniref:hypothetical protein n=1 Tax=Amycolatopsis sp. TNS106 TaxID=2861750 RepID=UPI001C5736B9|nr:hypothetical protein [Amycolatopsis sp. TNS106]